MSRLAVGILLAAGQSRRFGSNKLLYPIDNTPMLLLTAQKLVSVLSESIVVINQELASYTTQLKQLGLRVVVNERANHGMGSSIACGIGASQDAAGWLIALADMPYVKTETITQLSNRLNDGADLVAPVYDQQRGHPVAFSRGFRNELITLNDDVGARHIIAKHQKRLELIATNDSGVIMDVDQVGDIK